MEANREELTMLSNQILKLAHDELLVHMRFFDVALSQLHWQERKGTGCVATDGEHCFYDAVYILKQYQKEPKYITHLFLHVLLHFVFSHSYRYDKVEQSLWDMAVDIAVENVILDMNVSSVTLERDEEARRKLNILKEDIGALTAEKVYRYLKHNPLTPNERQEYIRLFQKDVHSLWQPREQLEMTVEQWKKISERIKADLKSFTKRKAGADTLEKNLEEATKDRYDYSDILRRFTVMGEDIAVNDEEFDYIYYTYGLEHYGNLPLIEPLEYKETKKVKEFVIAIDTSASCRGPIVKAFLQKTYSILKSTENFFHKVNIHIVQCDNEVQSDTKITNDDDFQTFMQYGKLKGFGATDFRPVFEYVEKLQTQGEFENLKGLIYFTDGYGVYPEWMPKYDVIFAFLDEDENRAPVPPWSMKVILEQEELEDELEKEQGDKEKERLNEAVEEKNEEKAE